MSSGRQKALLYPGLVTTDLIFHNEEIAANKLRGAEVQTRGLKQPCSDLASGSLLCSSSS